MSTEESESYSFWCERCGERLHFGAWPFCPHGVSHGGHLLSAIHPSERTVVYRNPRTGEVRYPARNDQPLPKVYAGQGYQREELKTAQDIRSFEKETGRIHERSHYDPGSATAERDLSTPIVSKSESKGKMPLPVSFQRT